MFWQDLLTDAATFHNTGADSAPKRITLEGVPRPARAPRASIIPPLPRNASAAIYRPEFAIHCRALMGEGYSRTAVAGVLGISVERLDRWAREHDDLAEAIAAGRAARHLAGEKHLLDVMRDGGQPSQLQAVVFHLRNLGGDEWRDRQTIDHTGKIDLAALVNSTMAALPAPEPCADDMTIDGEPL